MNVTGSSDENLDDQHVECDMNINDLPGQSLDYQGVDFFGDMNVTDSLAWNLGGQGI